MKTMIPVYFYIPQNDLPNNEIPPDLDINEIDAYLQPFGTSTIYSWTLQTYLRLRASGFPCKLTSVIPEEGILIASRGSLSFRLKPTSKLLIVCLLADGGFHAWTQLHVVQNYRQSKITKDSYYIPHWPQPGLIPRSNTRGELFENVAYFGDVANLAPEFQSPLWLEEIQSLGLNWHVISPSRWNDYSDIDAIVAVRSFNKQDYIHKPATKLYNSWLAGVPAILGHESAYQSERKSELDYIEVTSPSEIISALKRLRDHKQLRQAIMENSRVRSQEINFTNLVVRWCDFITQIAIPEYERWSAASHLSQQYFFIQKYLSLRINGVKHRLFSS
ncbi:hypothetical protein DSM106972_024450 [Dulcicalothrix desertica PCC 7102]|uniref:Glycosyl transferase n=1 Tax=Dulcicalothrix desertica PCC 7102 TaxID=232991 RepID=A0A3S1J3T7_9CYAN|nr:hypothetical protein [Dulcicalothrix desertica]RUT07184.1 hypothetical protein DSM106972_024450 [Dulcicalothrix desertica PCC 7102]TWH61821.1 hypothetical protein CAL7102_00498 [Dulcicalothrix desertica PCC 7102]